MIKKTEIEYIEGDATNPVEIDGMKIILHICNDQGAWGAGFVVALSKRWPEPESVYRRIAKEGLLLGDIQVVQVSYNTVVVNMIAQTLGWTQGPNGKMTPPIDYEALDTCLKKVSWMAQGLTAIDDYGLGVHVVGPRFGAGLAGGKWSEVEKLINFRLCDEGIPVFIYDLPAS